MAIIRRKKPRFRDVLSRQRFDVQQVSEFAGEMRAADVLAFWFFLARHAASNVEIIIEPGMLHARSDVS